MSSRTETLLNSIASGEPSGVTPKTREEAYLSYIAGESDTYPTTPTTRKEFYLDKIAQNGAGGGSSGGDSKIAKLASGEPFVVTSSDLEGVTHLAERAFGYTSIKSIEIPESVTSGAEAVFYKCNSLSTIYFNASNLNTSSSTPRIFEYAGTDGTNFPNKEGITVKIGENISKITDSLFYSMYGNNISVVEFPQNSICNYIGSRSFKGCRKLKKIINFPQNLPDIGGEIFQSCELLESIELGNTPTIIGYYAFSGCKSLKSIVIPNSVQYIDNNVFYGCDLLVDVVVGSGVLTIGYNSLSVGSSSAKATIKILATKPPTIQSNTIGANVEKIIVPKGCLEAYQSATNWSAKASIMQEAE